MRFLKTALMLCFAGVVPLFSAQHAPLHQTLMQAKHVFLLNMTDDEGTFDGIYAAVKKWGRWEVVQNREQAEVALALTSSDSMAVVATGSTVVPMISKKRILLIVDPQSGSPFLTVSCERRFTGSGTGDVLVSKARKRIEAN